MTVILRYFFFTLLIFAIRISIVVLVVVFVTTVRSPLVFLFFTIVRILTVYATLLLFFESNLEVFLLFFHDKDIFLELTLFEFHG